VMGRSALLKNLAQSWEKRDLRDRSIVRLPPGYDLFPSLTSLPQGARE
jgi:hypothetical protein